MPREERLRAEVHRIADSIEVDTEANLAALMARSSSHGGAKTWLAGGPGRGRLLVPLAAAASIAVLVVAVTTVTEQLAGSEHTTDRAPVILAGAPDGTVPSVFGHTRESASVLLGALGLDVRYGKQISCDPAGRPVATEPAVGTPVSPGETVTVLLSYQGPTTDCAADLRDPWRFVDFATGRGPSPRFAGQVRLFVDGVRTATLSGAEAASGDWGAGSALAVLRQGTQEVLRVGDSFQMPQLQVTPGTPPESWCGIARPNEVGDREALTLTLDFAEVPGQPHCPARVGVYESAGAIDAVVAWSESAGESDLRSIPDVVGLSLAEARDRVSAAGWTVRVEEQETCHPRRGVVEEAPTQRDIEEDTADDPGYDGPVTLVVEIPHTTRDCAGLDAAASGFLRFARGGPPPAWAPEVQQLLGYARHETITAAAADDPDTWSLCSGLAPEDCDVSPLAVAARDAEVTTGESSHVTHLPGGEFCELIDLGGLPTHLSVDQQIVLSPAEPATCEDDWSVWLWIDEAGRITAVNLLVPAGAPVE